MNKLVALLGWKYEPSWMVSELKENLKGWVDDFCILDCRGRDELWIHEGEYRAKLRQMAKEKKADWAMFTSPDERWEKDAGKIIRPMIDNNKDRKILEPILRELYTPNQYRIDGIWAGKYRRRIWPLLDGLTYKYQRIQCPSPPENPEFEVVNIPVNIYHLKMIEPENRKLRAEIFKKLDPTNEFQWCGYDYLANDDGMVLEEIPKGKEYYPKYRKYIFKVPENYLCE
jgi:hypothetical protein